MSYTENVDVFIVGAGPVGLFSAVLLTRLGLSVRICDILPEAGKAGKADALNPRSLECLEQLGFIDELMAINAPRTTNIKMYAEGHLVNTVYLFDNEATEFPYMYNLGQHYVEAALYRDLKKNGVSVERPVTALDFEVDENATYDSDEYPITVSLMNVATEVLDVVKAKFVIGADGAHSHVRRRLGIHFGGDRTDVCWGALDAVIIKTNFPFGDSFNVLHGKNGSGMIANREANLKRIYVKIETEEGEKLDKRNFTCQHVLDQIKKRLEPFEFEFGDILWYSHYIVGQHIADTFSHKDRIFLAGDSGHCHSPSSAQGLNIGLADAWNLTWKIFWVIRGYAHPSLLQTYEAERKAVAEVVIKLDKMVAALAGNASHAESSPGLNSNAQNEYAWLAKKNKDFNSGLGVDYDPSWLNLVDGFTDVFSAEFKVRAGQRAPDAHIVEYGTNAKKRIFTEFSRTAQFNIFIFANDLLTNKDTIEGILEYFGEENSVFSRMASRPKRPTTVSDLFKIMIITTTTDRAVIDELEIPDIKNQNIFIDELELAAHPKYLEESQADKGGIIVVRPDGYIGCAIILKEYRSLEEYFERLGNFGQSC